MWTTFKDCLDTILSNLDDFAIIIFILIVGNKIADLLYRFIVNFMQRSLFTAQALKLSLQAFIGVISFVHLVGEDIIKHASAGIAIGVGYAFQPYIISMFNGLMLHNDNLINSKKYLDVPSQGIKGAAVSSIGLFNTVLINQDGDKIVVSNSSLTESAVTIHCSEPDASQYQNKHLEKCKRSKGWHNPPAAVVSAVEDNAMEYMHRQIHHNPAFSTR
jgi:small-conductance mechanosensitive channel